eukprot:TRINITY_DN1415_c0_g1_i1.p1 TRINITY_DN1415_c0_g1~~TRINITY_DN1415_c0_g1_i1.p1  ORF type:complete len:157 (-),score=86.92 TRINITY_DN1415_c0_g1_i1:180-587(-)
MAKGLRSQVKKRHLQVKKERISVWEQKRVIALNQKVQAIIDNPSKTEKLRSKMQADKRRQDLVDESRIKNEVVIKIEDDDDVSMKRASRSTDAGLEDDKSLHTRSKSKSNRYKMKKAKGKYSGNRKGKGKAGKKH